MSLTKVKTILFIAITGLLPLLYNQCASTHEGASAVALGKSFNGDCAQVDEIQLFGTSFAPFLTKNCSSCHAEGGEGKGAFATPALNVAWNAFRPVGYKKIAAYAVDNGHNPPYSGRQHAETVQVLKFEWEQGLVALKQCDALSSVGEYVDDPYKDKRISFISQALSPDSNGTTKTISWRINDSMLPPPPDVTLPNAPGAIVSLSYTARRDAVTGVTYYEFFNPMARDSSTDLLFKSLRLKINGEFVKNETTFTFMDSAYRAGSPAMLLETGRMTAISPVLLSDVVALTFGEITPTVLPPIPPGPEINFSIASSVATEGETVEFQVELSQPIDDLVTVEIAIAGSSSATPKCCNIIRTYTNENQPIDNFDVDYNIKGITLTNNRILITFLPPTISFNFTLELENDDRYESLRDNENFVENSESIQFNIVAFSIHKSNETIPGKVGLQASTKVYILDNDTQPPIGSVTFSSLMQPGGILRENCVKCHNPNEKVNGVAVPYVMTTYENLQDKSRLDVNSPTTSLLFLRMNGDTLPDGEGGTLLSMPLDGLLDETVRLQVERWLIQGAQNN